MIIFLQSSPSFLTFVAAVTIDFFIAVNLP